MSCGQPCHAVKSGIDPFTSGTDPTHAKKGPDQSVRHGSAGFTSKPVKGGVAMKRKCKGECKC